MMTTPITPDPSRWSELTPDWWSLVAGAAVAGAVLVPKSRFVAGAAFAAAALALALSQLPPQPTAGGTTGTGAGKGQNFDGGPIVIDHPPPVDPGALLMDADVVRSNGVSAPSGYGHMLGYKSPAPTPCAGCR